MKAMIALCSAVGFLVGGWLPGSHGTFLPSAAAGGVVNLPVVTIQGQTSPAKERGSTPSIVPGTFRIARDSAAPTALTVFYSVSGSATLDADYDLIGGPGSPVSAVIPAGAASHDVSPGIIRVSRNAPAPTPLTVLYDVTGTATPGIDYIALPGSATIPPNATFVDVPVTPVADSVEEPDETVQVTPRSDPAYSLPYHYPLLRATVTIRFARPTRIGLYRGGDWQLDTSGNGDLDDCTTDTCVTWLGYDGETPVVGDWNGDGKTEIGVYRSGVWVLDWDGSGTFDGCSVDKCSGWLGYDGETPVVGDWNGDGKTEIGVYRNGVWVLDKNGNGVFEGCDTDTCLLWFGLPNEIPVVGDWSGDGRTKIGVYAEGHWFLDVNGSGVWDGCRTDAHITWFGFPGERPVVGDWTGDGKAKIGVYVDGFWGLDWNGDGRFNGCAVDTCLSWLGTPGGMPLVGDWNGDGKTKVGLYIDGRWGLDANGNGAFDGCEVDICVALGGEEDAVPVLGKW